MNGIEITDVIICHRSGAMLVEQRLGQPRTKGVDVQFLTGYFTAMLNTLNIFQKHGFFRRIGDHIELWVNDEACCCVCISEFYTIIAFVRLTDRNQDTRNVMLAKVARIKERFEEKFMKVLLGWNQNLQVFKGFENEIKSILEEK